MIAELDIATSAMDMDLVLLQQLEEFGNGQTIHKHANLSAAYRGALEEYERTGDEAYRLLAGEAHRQLRILLVTMRESAFSIDRFGVCSRFDR